MKKEPVIWRIIWTVLKFDPIFVYLSLTFHFHSFQTLITLILSRFDTGAKVMNPFCSDSTEDTVRKAFFTILMCSMRSPILGWWFKWHVSLASILSGWIRTTWDLHLWKERRRLIFRWFIYRHEQWIKHLPRTRQDRGSIRESRRFVGRTVTDVQLFIDIDRWAYRSEFMV